MDAAITSVLLAAGIAATALGLFIIIPARNKRQRMQAAMREAADALAKRRKLTERAERLKARIDRHRIEDAAFRAFYDKQMRERDINILSVPSDTMMTVMRDLAGAYANTNDLKYHSAMFICFRNLEEWLDTHYPVEKEE